MISSRFQQRVLCYLVLLAMAACSAPSTPAQYSDKFAPLRALSVPSGGYYEVVWPTADRLVVIYRADPAVRGVDSRRLWSAGLDGQPLHEIELRQQLPAGCEVVQFTDALSLGGDRVAIRRRCIRLDGSKIELLVWSGQDDSSQIIFPIELPAGAASFAFSPDLASGIFSTYTSLGGQLYWLDTGGFAEVDVNLDRAGQPSWSPDGELIAFFGAPNLPGAPNPDWATRPNNLYLLPANCKSLKGGCHENFTEIVPNVLGSFRVTWSPQGKWLAFDGALNEDEYGVWLYNTDTQLTYRIAEGKYGSPEWSPDGKSLVVLAPPVSSRPGSLVTHRPGLYVLDLASIVDQ